MWGHLFGSFKVHSVVPSEKVGVTFSELTAHSVFPVRLMGSSLFCSFTETDRSIGRRAEPHTLSGIRRPTRPRPGVLRGGCRRCSNRGPRLCGQCQDSGGGTPEHCRYVVHSNCTNIAVLLLGSNLCSLSLSLSLSLPLSPFQSPSRSLCLSLSLSQGPKLSSQSASAVGHNSLQLWHACPVQM
jgi:hypothetical protein